MGFYNVQQGDVPYFKTLADTYAMSDNYHQAVNGGTGRQPHHARYRRCDLVQRRQRQSVDAAAQPDGGCRKPERRDRRRDRKSQPAASGTNNWYTQDGYGGGSYG